MTTFGSGSKLGQNSGSRSESQHYYPPFSPNASYRVRCKVCTCIMYMLGSHGFPKCTNTVICIGGLWHDNTSNFALKPFNFINRKAILLSSLLILLIWKLALNFRKNYCHYCNPLKIFVTYRYQFSVSDPDPGPSGSGFAESGSRGLNGSGFNWIRIRNTGYTDSKS